MTREAMEHVERPRLPWQTERLTECGKAVEEFQTVLSREEYDRKVRDQGKQRAAISTCMTCINRAQYSAASWEDDPASVMHRHCERSGWHPGQTRPIQVELRALALLVEAHRDEFDQAVADLTSAVPLIQRRKAPKARRIGRSL